MKTLFKQLFFISASVVFLLSCTKDQSIDSFSGGTTPVLTATASSSIPLNPINKANTVVTFSWTNPNYQFTSGISSQNVSYLLEIDTLGANFTNPNRISVGISSDLSISYTDTLFNAAVVNQMLLKTGVAHTLQVRITASINSVKATNLVSNVLQFTVTPYALPPVVPLPSSGQLFIVGGDTKLGGWSNPVPVTQQFTQVTPTEYKITIALSGGDPTNSADQFLLLPVNGSWSTKYACVAANNTSAGGTFGFNQNDNFPGPTVAGTYVIDVDFQHGKYTVTKQ